MRQIVEKSEISFKKKKSALKGIRNAILIILLVPIILAGLLYLYLNAADFQYDNTEKILSQDVPMTFSQRHSFDAANMTSTMRLNNADIYYLTKDVMPDLHYSEAVYVNAYRIALEDKSVYVQGKAYGINIPVRIGFDVQWKDGDLLMAIRDAHLGKLSVPLPVKWLSEKFGFDLEFALPAYNIPVLEKAMDYHMEAGYLQVTYPVDRSIVSEGISAWVYLKPAWIYITEEDEIISLLADIQKNWTKDDYKSPKLSEFMKKMQQNPDTYQELKVKMLAAAPENYAVAYFSSKEHNPNDMARFYPGITKQAVDEMRNQMHYTQNYEFITKLAYDIDEKFANRTITVRNGKFINTKNNSVIAFNSLYEASPEAGEVFPEGTKFCAVLCEGPESRQKIGKRTYGAATAIQFKNGRCMVISKMNDRLYYSEIPAQEYDDLASGKTLVYIAEFKG